MWNGMLIEPANWNEQKRKKEQEKEKESDIERENGARNGNSVSLCVEIHVLYFM